MAPSEILVFLGRHNLTLVGERGSETRSISKAIVHPDWKFNHPKYDADLAVLVLERAVDFTTLIQPVCMPKDPKIMEQVDGTVVSLSGLKLWNFEKLTSLGFRKASFCFVHKVLFVNTSIC